MNNDNFDYKKSVNFLKNKERSDKKLNRGLFLQAEKDFNAIVDVIKKYNPNKIYQWGSLLNEKKFDVNSDIDIAIEGINSTDNFFELYGIAMSMTDFPLDLIEIEKIDPIHRESIKIKGKVIYEK